MSEYSGKAPILFNLVGYYTGWAACILTGARGDWYLGAGLGIVLVAVHVGLAARPGVETKLLLLVVVMGYAVDSALTALGLLVFQSGQPTAWLAPVWIAVIWMLFSGTLRYTFSWLTGRPWLAAVLGAAGGPAAFYAGHRLGAVEFHPIPGMSLAVLAVAWAAMFPLLMHLSVCVGEPEPGRYRVPSIRVAGGSMN